MKTVGINKFVLRQTQDGFAGTRVTVGELDRLVGLVQSQLAAHENVQSLTNSSGGVYGYIVVIDNEMLHDVEGYEGLNIRSSYIHEDDWDRPLVDSLVVEYETRREGELPFLTRYIDWKSSDLPVATHLHCVLYSREQLQSENEECSGADYDLIAVNAEMGMKGAPMTPVTMMRNHLGPDFGGNGNLLDAEKYKESVEFWSKHILVKKGE